MKVLGLSCYYHDSAACLVEVVECIRAGPLARSAARLSEACHARMHEPGEGHPSKLDDLGFVLFRSGSGSAGERSAGKNGASGRGASR